ncbi:MAG: hypothetical protein GXO77_14345 [Calditrichaeota bacterium]|nr:hypothetical protein [Calditrichota bacterium]
MTEQWKNENNEEQMKRKSLLGFVWFTREEWEKMHRIAVDPERLENTYEEWKRMVTDAIEEFEAQGYSIVKVSIDVNEFLRWCKVNDKQPDAESRSQFANYKMIDELTR